MIQATELRIGNWIKGAYEFQIEEIKKNGNFNIYDPIPLNSEILEKCGVEKSIKYNFFSIDLGEKERIYRIYPHQDGFELVLITDNDAFELANFTYLHQLQNLVFALTGNELLVVNLVSEDNNTVNI